MSTLHNGDDGWRILYRIFDSLVETILEICASPPTKEEAIEEAPVSGGNMYLFFVEEGISRFRFSLEQNHASGKSALSFYNGPLFQVPHDRELALELLGDGKFNILVADSEGLYLGDMLLVNNPIRSAIFCRRAPIKNEDDFVKFLVEVILLPEYLFYHLRSLSMEWYERALLEKQLEAVT